MTERELHLEWRYRFEERLAILAGTEEPKQSQIEIAQREADYSINQLRHEN